MTLGKLQIRIQSQFNGHCVLSTALKMLCTKTLPVLSYAHDPRFARETLQCNVSDTLGLLTFPWLPGWLQQLWKLRNARRNTRDYTETSELTM